MNYHPQNKDIVFTEINGIGIVSLNRAQVLNALNCSMVTELRDHLLKWEEDPKIHTVILQSFSQDFFCAGGDLKEIYKAQKEGDKDHLNRFIDLEYEVVRLIATYPKPYISLISGLCMGGGMGMTIHGNVRVVTSDTIMAMPEVNIGYFPDVGASAFLSKCPGKSGVFLGLTGYQMNAADALYTGLATHYVSKENFSFLFGSLTAADIEDHPKDGIYAILDLFGEEKSPQISGIEQHRAFIDEVFSGETIEDIFVNLKLSKNQWRRKVEEYLESASPGSLEVTLELLKNTSKKSFDDVLKMEVELAKTLVMSPEFHEGIRAAVIDKDRVPKWERA
jgi:enoyl-CoA hydratase/carnithine racemase